MMLKGNFRDRFNPASSLARVALPVFAMAAFMLVCAFFCKTAYARDVRVFYNGNEIKYSVPAQIIEERTMVPLSQTFEALVGMGTIYEPSTRTSTFYANGHKNVHTIGTNVVYVDGSPIYYDTISRVIGDRALVPIRMITDTSGFQVEWDPVNYFVLITGGGASGTASQATPAPTPGVEQPSVQIISFESAKTTVNQNESVVLTVKTNSTATNVWINDGTNNLPMTYATLESNGIKSWVLAYTAKQTVTLQAYANTTQNTTGAAQKSLALTVNVTPAQISSAVANKTSVGYNEAVTITLKTNNTVSNVWAECNNTTVQGVLSSTDASGVKTWTITVTPTSTQQIRVYAGNAQNDSNAAQQTISVTVGATASVIHSVTPDKTTISAGESVTLLIRTNNVTTYVWVECNSTSVFATLDSTDSAGIKTWRCTVNPTSSQSIRVSTNTTQTLTNAAVNNSTFINVTALAVSISNVTVSPQSYAAGDTVTVVVYTNSAANFVWLETDGGTVNCSLTNTDLSTGNKTWQVQYRPGYGGTYYAYAGKTSGSREASRTYSITQTTTNPEVYDVTSDPGYVIVDGLSITRNTFTVKTNSSVNEVQIFANGQYFKATNYTISGSFRIWVITADLKWSGMTYSNGKGYEIVEVMAYFAPIGGVYTSKTVTLDVRS